MLSTIAAISVACRNSAGAY
ncbi:TPA: Vmc-like lipoprotein signal peptide domain-containing protein [Escherichia coli]